MSLRGAPRARGNDRVPSAAGADAIPGPEAVRHRRARSSGHGRFRAVDCGSWAARQINLSAGAETETRLWYGEREVASAAGGRASADDDLTTRTASITAAEIGDARARALGETSLTVELDGVLYCHASPRRDDEMLTRLSTPERWARALDGVDAALVVAGHTHQQDDRVVGGVRFVNAGSVGLPYEGDGAARWLWVADGVPELRRTAYDAAGTGRRILAAGWPDERSVRAALVEPVEPIVVTRIFQDIARGG
jgi:diadenosine tetraphosphatase ApaH/serine/threonine PP2A family protein phosphatase